MRKIITLAVASALMMGISACQSTAPSISVTQAGEEVKIPIQPQKIVVMDFGALDTLDALGAGNRVIAAPVSNIPTYLQQYHNAQIQDSGKMKEPDIAGIKAVRPDLIIMSGRQNKFYKDLSAIAPTLNYSVNTGENYYSVVKDQIRMLGKIAGKEVLAQEQLKALDLKINAARQLAQHSGKKAIVVLHNDGNVMLMNRGSYSALIFDELHVKRTVNVKDLPVPDKAENGRPARIMVDNQFIAQYHPDIIYVVDRSKAIGNTPMRSNYFDNKVMHKAGTLIVNLSADLWYLSGNGLESLNRQIDEVIRPLNGIN